MRAFFSSSDFQSLSCVLLCVMSAGFSLFFSFFWGTKAPVLLLVYDAGASGGRRETSVSFVPRGGKQQHLTSHDCDLPDASASCASRVSPRMTVRGHDDHEFSRGRQSN